MPFFWKTYARNYNVSPVQQTLTIRSLAAFPGFFEVSGPGALARLLNRAGPRPTNPAGMFWMDEDVLLRVRSAARSDLVSQLAQSKQPFAPGMDRSAKKMQLQELIRLYMRHVLRFDLAICKDWTAEFHGYARLPLGAADKLIAMVGPIRRQPAVSSADPQHAAVAREGIWLDGMETQYVIDLRFAANAPFAAKIDSPLEL
jgi:hypothetical protein